MINVENWIQELNLKPHPEGGFYKETYRSAFEIDKNTLPVGYEGTRRLSTSIYYLLRSGEISRLHRLRSDEVWYYHFGSPVKVILIDKEGNKKSRILGPRIDKAEKLQIVIPAGTIFAAEVVESDSYSLFGCVVSPGFEFSDFEMFDKDDLLQAYPKLSEVIEKYV